MSNDTTKRKETKSSRRIVFTMGGRGGTGKTTASAAIIDYVREKGIPFELFDADVENKEKGSISQFNPDAKKIDIGQERGLDAFVDHLFEGGKNLAIADLGAGSGADTFKWFDKMHSVLAKEGVLFTAVGVIVNDPSSAETVFNWAARLRDRVSYLIVKNERDGETFPYFDSTEQGKKFVEMAQPVIITCERRETDIQSELNARGVTLTQALAAKNGDVGPELKRFSTVVRMRGLKDRFDTELAKADHILLP